jgi:hydrogenase-1 operon protein HyaE
MNFETASEPLAPPEPPATQAPPLVARLVDTFGAQWVDADNTEAFAGGPGDRVLFFSGDPVRFPECLDVAVVLPELQAAFPGRLTIGVVLPRDEDAVARRWGAQRWPSLVFVREGRYVTTVAGMLDWTEFVARVGEALAMPATRRPGIGIPVVAGDAPSSCH